jgi:hypothetical protein
VKGNYKGCWFTTHHVALCRKPESLQDLEQNFDEFSAWWLVQNQICISWDHQLKACVGPPTFWKHWWRTENLDTGKVQSFEVMILWQFANYHSSDVGARSLRLIQKYKQHLYPPLPVPVRVASAGFGPLPLFARSPGVLCCALHSIAAWHSSRNTVITNGSRNWQPQKKSINMDQNDPEK